MVQGHELWRPGSCVGIMRRDSCSGGLGSMPRLRSHLVFEVCSLRAQGLESGELRPRPETHRLGRHEDMWGGVQVSKGLGSFWGVVQEGSRARR